MKRILQMLTFIGVILIILYSDRDRPIKFPLYLVFYLLYILYEFYSAFVLLDRTFKLNYLFSNHIIGSFNILFIIENIPIYKKDYLKYYKWSKNILIIAFIVIIYQQVVDSTFYLNTEYMAEELYDNESTSRLASIYSWLDFLSNGYCFVPIFIIVVEYLVTSKKQFVVWLLIGIIYAILTKARWIMLNALLVFLVIIIHSPNKMAEVLKYSILVPIFLVFSYLSLNAVGINATKIVEDRILETNKTNNHKSATTRLLAVKVFNKLFWEKPLFGNGNMMYGMGGTGSQDYKLRSLLGQRSSQIHVGYLSLFYMYGFVGGMFFMIFLFLLMRKLFLDAKKTGAWGPFLGFMGFVLSNLTLVTFSIFELGFIIAFLANKYHVQQYEEQEQLSIG